LLFVYHSGFGELLPKCEIRRNDLDAILCFVQTAGLTHQPTGAPDDTATEQAE
jgi:hypothetical protein